MSNKLKLNLSLSLLFFSTAIVIASFKLPEIKINKLLSVTEIKELTIDSKTEKLEVDDLKTEDTQKINNIGFGVSQHFSRTQLILINVGTFFLIFFIFLIKIKYFD